MKNDLKSTPNVTIKKPRMRWLFGGIGFHNSEATMTGVMNETMKNEVVLKTFREISPTFSRVFAGFADWTKSAMDAFADYYDATFRKAGTLLYIVPGRMPFPDDKFDVEAYAEKVAQNLDYLVNVRRLHKIRYYCVTNELSCGNTWRYLAGHMDLFTKLHTALYHAFAAHGLDIGLIATDISAEDDEKIAHIEWATQNMDEITEAYCSHSYEIFEPGNPNAYTKLYNVVSEQVQLALAREKRFILGEYGLFAADRAPYITMLNDGTLSVDHPEAEAKAAIEFVEMGLAALNAGALSAVMWTMFDYPDPFLREMGDTAAEKARYEAARYSGHGLGIRYNKHGFVCWCDEEDDYGARASLYTMGYFAKLFRKGARVLDVSWEDPNLRAGAVTNADGSMSLVVINWSDAPKSLSALCEHALNKPLRKYVYEAHNVPYNPFNDLPSYAGLVDAADGRIYTELPPLSVVFLTTDYTDRTPSAITDITAENGKATWSPCLDAEHCYYRVYKNGAQIASTVAEFIVRDDLAATDAIEVYSVDKFGNCANPSHNE